MKLPRRRQFLRLAAGTAVLPAVLRTARTQAYPTRPLRIVVTFPAGGQADARLLAEIDEQRFVRLGSVHDKLAQLPVAVDQATEHVLFRSSQMSASYSKRLITILNHLLVADAQQNPFSLQENDPERSATYQPVVIWRNEKGGQHAEVFSCSFEQRRRRDQSNHPQRCGGYSRAGPTRARAPN